MVIGLIVIAAIVAGVAFGIRRDERRAEGRDPYAIWYGRNKWTDDD